MLDMSETTKAKSDQLNAADLIGAPITILITKVTMVDDIKQPILIDYEGGEGRPWKPNLGFRRGLIAIWGKDGETYVGRNLTLFREPTVLWAGSEEGGIRVSHASHIDKPVTFKLVLTRKKSVMHTIKPLSEAQPSTNAMSEDEYTSWCESFNSCSDMAALSKVGAQIKDKKYDPASSNKLKEEYKKATDRIRNPEPAIESTEGTPEPSYCPSWTDLSEQQEENPDGVQNAIAEAAEQYSNTCGDLKVFADIDSTNQAQCSTVSSLVT